MSLFDALLARSRDLGFPLAIELPDGRRLAAHGEVLFTVKACNPAGVAALQTLSELPMSEAYVRGDLDFDGDFVRALALLRDALSDEERWLKIWRRLQPWLFGRKRFNPAWIAKHYDSGNIQLLGVDRDWNTYTPGLYEGDDDTLERGAARKLGFAFDQLKLEAGDSLLEIGCGWGGFTRFASRRKVKVTGITLSRDQLAFTRGRLAEDGLEADVRYQDFFEFEPGRTFDAISMMGVIEDLSDYPRVMARIARWVRPGGRIYLDFAAAVERVATSSFVTKHVWPGSFRMVYMPEFVAAVTASPLELAALWNDRRNYHLWAKKGHERWLERKEEIVKRSSLETWRLMRVLFAGTAGAMDSPRHDVTAFRVLLERPADALLR